MKNLAFKLWSGLKAIFAYPTDGPFRALLMNTKGMAQRRSSRLWKPPLAWLRLAITNADDAGNSWISCMASLTATATKKKFMSFSIISIRTSPKTIAGSSHPDVHFHFTPTHTSWLNQIECWFSILSRQALQGASFVDIKQLREAIDDFTSAYNTQATPFEGRQGEIKQEPMRNNIAYFRR